MTFGIFILVFHSALSFATTKPANFESLLSLTMPQRLVAVQKLKPQSFQYLSRAAFAKENSLLIRWRALITMGRVDAEHFKGDLERALGSQEWFMRNAALIAVQSADRQYAVQVSTRLLLDPALVVRTQAVRNLIHLNARESDAVLWKEIFASRNFRADESLWVRVHMAEALAQFATPERVKPFLRLLSDPDERLHKWAIRGLETATGFKIGDGQVPIEVRRQQWLERLEATL